MIDIIRKLAKQIQSQNIFIASKEMNGIRLFENEINLSKIQQIYLSFLYFYDTINRDLQIDKISPHIFDSDLYEDSYMLWKREIGKDYTSKPDNQSKDVKLVKGTNIKFPVRGNNNG
jgi:hypothetical protein